MSSIFDAGSEPATPSDSGPASEYVSFAEFDFDLPYDMVDCAVLIAGWSEERLEVVYPLPQHVPKLILFESPRPGFVAKAMRWLHQVQTCDEYSPLYRLPCVPSNYINRHIMERRLPYWD